MGTIIGVVVGYALGTRAGDEGWEEFKDAWKVISTSEEVRDLLAAGFSIGREFLSRGTEVFIEVLGQNGHDTRLRPVA
jgi:hypothetical protein